MRAKEVRLVELVRALRQCANLVKLEAEIPEGKVIIIPRNSEGDTIVSITHRKHGGRKLPLTSWDIAEEIKLGCGEIPTKWRLYVDGCELGYVSLHARKRQEEKQGIYEIKE